MRVTKSYHDAPKGIQLSFDPELTDEGLKQYLGSLGFKEANRKKGVWYIRGNRPSYDRYTDALEKAYNEGRNFMDVFIQPSYEPALDNITHKMFSLVTATISIEADQTENIDYVIFEDFRVSAFDIATRFLKQQYGDRLQSIQVTAKNLKGRAEKAFAQEHIIVATEPQEAIQDNAQQKPFVTDPLTLTNESGVYTKETAGDRYEELLIPMPSTLKFEASIKLVQNEQDQYVYGLGVINNLSDWGGYSFAPSKVDTVYPTKPDALAAAILQILEGVRHEYTEALRMGASKALQTAYKKTIAAIYAFADRMKIQLPEDKTKAILPLSIEEEPKNVVGNEQSLTTLNEDVGMLVDELRELETQMEDKGIASKIGNVKIDLEEHFQRLQGKPLNDALKRIYSTLLDIGNTLLEGRYRDQFFTTLEKLKTKAGIIPFEVNKNFQFTITQGRTTLDDALIREFQDFIELYRNALHLIYEKSQNDEVFSILKVRISSDRATIDFLHRKEDNTLKIDALHAHEEGMVSYKEGVIPEGKLSQAIRYMLKHPNTLQMRPAEVYQSADAIPTDIVYNNKSLLNVLVPEGVINFDFGNSLKLSKKEIKAAFPWLFEIRGKDLMYIIPSQLFVLTQFSDLKTLGIKVSKSDIQSHWLYYGEQLFNLLGYPTDMSYPYVNTQLGYYQVAILGDIIQSSKDNKHWWKAITSYRPIADMEQAVQHIDQIITSYQENEAAVTDADTTTKLIANYVEQRKKIQEYIIAYSNSDVSISNITTTETNASSIEVQPIAVTNEKVYVTDIMNYETFIPNVLIPRDIVAPFDAGSVLIKEAEKVREIGSHLLVVTDENLGKQDAKTLFELAQMPHPKDYGFGVHRSDLLQEWEKRGEILLETLGYPTNLEYPYVNIHVGYKSVSSLGNLIEIEGKGNKWWSVVQYARPIAEMDKALDFIAKEIESLVKIRLSYINPKTGKPKAKKNDKEQYRSLTFAIESFEGSRYVIQQYLESQEEKKLPTDTIEEGAVTIDDVEEETHYSNILLPEGIQSPFDTGAVTPEEGIELKEQFFYLFKYTYRTIHRASPLELFMLLQFIDLKASGISITKALLHRIWEKEGASLLAQLGYPTAESYPYVHIEKGYFEVLPLETIISKGTGVTNWWSVVTTYRPIADKEKALRNITERLDNRTKELAQEVVASKKERVSKEISLLRTSKKYLEAHLNSTSSQQASQDTDTLTTDMYREISKESADRIRRQFKTKGFTISFTGKSAFDRNLTIVELNSRLGYHQTQLEYTLEKEYDQWITTLEKEIEKLSGKTDEKSNQSRVYREERISSLLIEKEDLIKLVSEETKVFYDELFFGFIERAKAAGYTIAKGSVANFRLYIMTSLFQGRMLEHYPDMPINKAAYLLIDDYFETYKDAKETIPIPKTDYLDRVIATMQDHYIDGIRLSKKKIEAIKEQVGVPNMGVLWEAVELSWLLWYKTLYKQPVAFNNRLQMMISFWNKVQPTYAYSDSSKELYKQYSTPCPIGAMIAEYTDMSNATSIFEPSAGNGLLVVGADPSKTHVNEIDNSRRQSLEFQGFAKITHHNASEPFPKALTHTFDVVVTNPPFDRWSADAFDKARLVNKYFDSNIGLNRHLRLEHLMSGLALHTMKDSGKAALILKGHIKFREYDGYMATYRPFFNWLYSRYVVDDIINMNGYKLYNKQGAVTEMMLVLIGGRKPQKSKKVAPNREQAAYLADIADSFDSLWERIASHIKTPLQKEIEKLKIALGYDIF